MSRKMRELRVEDALMYLDQVKMEFGDRPHIYNEFLDIMKNFKSQQIDTPGVIERVSNLFHGNKKLVLGFNTFLPEGYKIELPIDGAPAVYHAPGQVGVTQIGRGVRPTAAPPGLLPQSAVAPPSRFMAPPLNNASGTTTTTNTATTTTTTNNNSSTSPEITLATSSSARQRLAAAEKHGRDHAEQSKLQQQAARNSQITLHPPPRILLPAALHPVAAVTSSHPGMAPQQQQQQQPGQPVEFDYAINYVTNIKKRFANQPDTYKNFLKILHTYQKEQRGIKEVLNEVSELFADHPDLLQEFTYFLPDAVQATAKAQLEAAVKMAEGRKKKNVQETAAHVAEARTQAILRAKLAAREQQQQQKQQRHEPESSVAVPTPASVQSSFSQQPFPVAFGATLGRSEEKEKDICRSAVYGQVSFAPARPPKRGELTASNNAAKYGWPRSVPDLPLQPNAKEEAFFERVKGHLNRKDLAPDKPASGSRKHTPYTEFLKVLHLFGCGILSREETVLLLKSLFEQGHAPKTGAGKANPKMNKVAQDLLADFESILVGRGPYASQQSTMKDRSKYGALSIRMCDFSRSDNPTPSYWTYPLDHPQKRYSHSGQSKDEGLVLNTVVVCVGQDTKRTSLENYDGPKVRKNVYEEIMFKIEDERFEVDMAIERNNSALRLVEPMAEEIISLKEGEERDGQPIGRMHYTLRSNTLGPVHIGAIARLYGDFGDEVVNHLLRNPMAVLPVVYKRMNEKNAEWRKVRTECNKSWKVAAAENYEGSLDVLCYSLKHELSHKLTLDYLREECRKIKHFLRLSNKHKPSNRSYTEDISAKYELRNLDSQYVLFQPYLAVKVGNGMPHKDAFALLSKEILKVAKSSSDRYKASRLWAEFLVPMFDLPWHLLLGEAQRESKSKNISFVAAYEAGQAIRTFYGDGIITNVGVSTQSRDANCYTVKLSYGIAYLRQSYILHTLPPSVPSSEEKHYVRLHDGKFSRIEKNMDVKDAISVKSCFTFFGSEKIYLFLRLYCVLVGILAEGYAYFSSVHSSFKNDVSSSDARCGGTDSLGRGISEASRPGDQYKKSYTGLLAALSDFLGGGMTSKTFEATCRTLCAKHVFKYALLPNILKKCAEELLKVVDEEAYLTLLDYARIPQIDISLLRELSLRCSDGASTYRLQYDAAAQSLMCCYVPEGSSLVVASSSIDASAEADYMNDADGENEEMADDDGKVLSEEDSYQNTGRDSDEEEENLEDDADTNASSLKRARLK